MAEMQLTPALSSDERFAALCALLHESLDELDISVILIYLIDRVRTQLLPYLADQFSLLDEPAWQLAESEDARRRLLKNAIALHRYKGTPWAIREVIRLLGFGEVEIQEGLGGITRTGIARHDGRYVHGDHNAWPNWRIRFPYTLTTDQGALLRRTLLSIAPARCCLVSLDYREVAIRHNGFAIRNGKYSRGSS